MAVNQPDLDSGGTGNIGAKSGITVGPATPASTTAAATSPIAPVKKLQTRWRPESFLNLHQRLADARQAAQASRALDHAFQTAFQTSAQLECMIACRQSGKTTVTGSAKSIPTGLATVTDVTVSIDNGATAHNFWVSGVISQQPGCIDIYCWQPTAAGDNTPIACTSAVVVRWSVNGTIG